MRGGLTQCVHKRVVAVEDGDAVGGNPGEKLGFGAENPFDRAEALEVRASDVGDDRDTWAEQLRQQLDLAEVVGADLDDAHGLVTPALQNGQRHTDVVVEIALRSPHGTERFERSARQILRRGLAVRPGDGHHGGAMPRKRGARQLLQAFERLVDHETAHRQMRPTLPAVAGDENAACPVLDGRLDVVVRIETLAAKRDEQAIRQIGACVGADAFETHVRVGAVGHHVEGLEILHHLLDVEPQAGPPCVAFSARSPDGRETSAARASSRSSNGRRSRPMIW